MTLHACQQLQAGKWLLPIIVSAFLLNSAYLFAQTLHPPQVKPPCVADQCPFAGQTVTILVNQFGDDPETGLISGVVYEVKQEFEAATGAKLEIIPARLDELFSRFVSDVSAGRGQYDAAIIGAWWLGELVAGDFLRPYDDFYADPRFPQWSLDDIQQAPRALLSYGDKHYMVANDHDGQVMYYRRDLLADPQHQTAFKQQYDYALEVPETWTQFRDIAEYFNGKDLNGDGEADYGVTMSLKKNDQGMFHFMSFSAPFVIGENNPKLYWFDPDTMLPLIDSEGHLRALETFVDLVQFGDPAMRLWNLPQSWQSFLDGKAALTFTWGDLGSLAEETNSSIKGVVGTAPLPGTLAYYDIRTTNWIKTEQPNVVGNTTGGSWSGVISKFAKAPEAAYYLLALLATPEKSSVYMARGWDGVDVGRFSHYLPPLGNADIQQYLAAGWNEADVRDYTAAYYHTFSNPLQFPYLRIPGAFAYWQVIDQYLHEVVTEQLSPEEALQLAAIDFEEITIRMGRSHQQALYKTSLGLE